MAIQLVVREQAGERRLELDDGAPLVTAAEGSHLHLGTQDLLRVAAYARENGYDVTKYLLADPYLMPLPPHEEREISEALLDITSRYGAEEVLSALDDEFGGVAITGVELRSKQSSVRTMLRRRGFIDTNETKAISELLQGALLALRLT